MHSKRKLRSHNLTKLTSLFASFMEETPDPRHKLDKIGPSTTRRLSFPPRKELARLVVSPCPPEPSFMLGSATFIFVTCPKEKPLKFNQSITYPTLSLIIQLVDPSDHPATKSTQRTGTTLLAPPPLPP